MKQSSGSGNKAKTEVRLIKPPTFASGTHNVLTTSPPRLYALQRIPMTRDLPLGKESDKVAT